ncbi:MAG: bifunctional diaminohydroxyphosphoribosylaminopyrimidine deaminase/5-amino-6-(5-phosphoribosylamino)uracil reductase RibD [Mycobacteriales bacterium]
MRRALELSHAVLGTTSPNPPVGAVVLDVHGAVVGEGATAPPGGPHAEVVALQQAGDRAHTAVVTLEPCDHTGRTGPCTEALLAAGVRRVVVGCEEPTALARGGARRLSDAGVEVVTGVLAEEVAAGPLAAWLHRQRSGRPLVTWKYAATLDGRSAAADGTSRWITGEAARREVHQLRAEVDAVVVGVGTVLADDPALTARPDPGHQPLRVVVDSKGRTPASARVLDGSAPTLVVTTGPSYGDDRTLVLPADADDRVDVTRLLDALADRGVVSVLLEGGPTLAGAFLRAGLVDRVVAYLAPALLGAGAPALQDAGVGTITDALRLHLTDVSRVGDDVRLTLTREKKGTT